MTEAELKQRVAKLEAENARLKQEVANIMAEADRLAAMVRDFEKEDARRRAKASQERMLARKP